MKKLVFIITLMFSMLASAGELLILDLPYSFHDQSYKWFKVNEREGTVSVMIHLEEIRGGRGGDASHVRMHEVIVPELSMIDKTLTLTVDGESIDCATLGESRVFKLPTLYVNGNCKLEDRAVRTSEGMRYHFFIKY